MPTPEPATSDDRNAAQIADQIARLAHRLRRASVLALEPLGLTPAQSRALRTVARSPEPIRMGELARRMGIVPRSATSLIDVLAEAGLVSRSTDPTNRRVVLVGLTEAGRQVGEQMSRARSEAATRILAPLSAQDAATLAGLLRSLDPL